MKNDLLKMKQEFIEKYLEKLFTGLNIPKEQIIDRIACKVYPDSKECYYLDGVLVLEFNLKGELASDKIELIFKVVKI